MSWPNLRSILGCHLWLPAGRALIDVFPGVDWIQWTSWLWLMVISYLVIQHHPDWVRTSQADTVFLNHINARLFPSPFPSSCKAPEVITDDLLRQMEQQLVLHFTLVHFNKINWIPDQHTYLVLTYPYGHLNLFKVSFLTFLLTLTRWQMIPMANCNRNSCQC